MKMTEKKFLFTKKKIAIILLFIGILLLVFIFDSKQQAQFNSVNTAYTEMENGDFEAALKKFEAYVNTKHTSLYWNFLELVNGKNSQVTYNNVKVALQKCKDQMH